jgi:hypothetical protein
MPAEQAEAMAGAERDGARGEQNDPDDQAHGTPAVRIASRTVV